MTLGSNIFVLLLLIVGKDTARPEPAPARTRKETLSPNAEQSADSARRHYRWDRRISSHAGDSGAITSTGFVRHRVIEAKLPRVQRDRPQPLVLKLLAEWLASNRTEHRRSPA